MALSISVVTACYNSAPYLEATLRSVVEQRYPALQYIVVDGASTDESPEILARYRDEIDVLISEPDEGQYHAIQKGMARAEGEIMGWLNADDLYYPWTFSVVNEVFSRFPQIDWLIGLPTFVNEAGQNIKVSTNTASAFPQTYIRNGWFRDHLAGYLQQESMFWRRSLWEQTGGLDLSLTLAADFELWTRFAERAELVEVVSPLAAFRERRGVQRSSVLRAEYEAEVEQVCGDKPPPPWLWDAIARRGIVWRSLCRLLCWKKTAVVAFSATSRQWELRRLRRPVSRATLLDLMLERSVRG
jgi:hypothetical protein